MAATCTVVGLGQLGCRIAVEIASHGFIIKAYDKDHWQRETLIRRAEQHWLQLERLELIDSATKFHDYIVVCSDLKTATQNADFIFEAASENIQVKKSLLKEITMHCESRSVIGTNTLTLPLNIITEDALFSERILGIRFIYPVFAIPFLEYATSSISSSETVEKAKSFFESMAKTLIQKSDADEPRKLDVAEVNYYHSQFRSQRMRASHQIAHGSTLPRPVIESSHGNPGNLSTNGGIKVPMRQEDTNDEGEKSDECVVCNENSINAILFPCRHMWLCFHCAQRLKTQNKPCPACRANIEEVVSVFKP